jgi:hypothetical protein
MVGGRGHYLNLRIELGEGVLDLLKTHRIGSLAARPISSLLRGLLKPAALAMVQPGSWQKCL